MRILKKQSQTAETADDDDTVYCQPLIEGIRDVMREYFPPAVPNVNQVTPGQSSGRQGQNQTQTP